MQDIFLKVIRILDDTWMDYVFSKIEKAGGSSPSKTETKTVSNTPLTPELFDSLF